MTVDPLVAALLCVLIARLTDDGWRTGLWYLAAVVIPLAWLVPY